MQGKTLRIFTAKQSQNQIEGILNLANFFPGAEYLDSAEEAWGTYYQYASGGVPFTIFYKNIWVNPDARDLFNRATSEFLQNLKDFDDFFYVSKPFFVKYPREQLKLKKSRKKSSSHPKDHYYPLIKTYRHSRGEMRNLL
jgi:hypothetical protein